MLMHDEGSHPELPLCWKARLASVVKDILGANGDFLLDLIRSTDIEAKKKKSDLLILWFNIIFKVESVYP